MKNVVITGASTGIGLYTAVELAKAGYNVIATMRDLSKKNRLLDLAEINNVKIDIQALDVANDETVICAFINDLIKKYKHLDVLINNAGMSVFGGTEQVDAKTADSIMQTNYFGCYKLTRAVLPHFRQNRQGHIINLSSIGGMVGQPFNDAYCASKFALEGMMESLAPVIKKFNIKISMIEPGPVNTDFVANVQAATSMSSFKLDADYQPLCENYKKATETVFANAGQTPEEIAKLILTALSDKEPSFRYQSSVTVHNLIKYKSDHINSYESMQRVADRL